MTAKFCSLVYLVVCTFESSVLLYFFFFRPIRHAREEGQDCCQIPPSQDFETEEGAQVPQVRLITVSRTFTGFCLRLCMDFGVHSTRLVNALSRISSLQEEHAQQRSHGRLFYHPLSPDDWVFDEENWGQQHPRFHCQPQGELCGHPFMKWHFYEKL